MPTVPRRALCWIRRDLRLHDHAALTLATQLADEVVVAFVFDTTILDLLVDKDDKRVSFIHQSLQELDSKLQRHGSKLVVRHGDPVVEIPALAQALGCTDVIAGRDYEPSSILRDASVVTALGAAGVQFQTVKDTVIFEGGEILSQSGTPFRVYTPYSNAWRGKFDHETCAGPLNPDLSKLVPAADLESHSSSWSFEDLGFSETSPSVPAGEDAGLASLDRFVSVVPRYSEDRDFPAKQGTSGLSVHLRFGTISIRDAVRMALSQDSKGAGKWLAELIWRDFYQDLLFHNPHVVTHAFQPQFDSVEYPGETSWFDAWCEGQTGYPLIDAAMRCLLATGWMHNRLRMVVASFLTKDLLIDYRRGESHFARYLLDFDLATNTGGWQWAASTGADAQPYFRIFNPVLQSLKFDPDGEFIRKWVPELSMLYGKSIHWPHEASAMELGGANVVIGETYPHPMVNHHLQRDKAIRLLETAKKQ